MTASTTDNEMLDPLEPSAHQSIHWWVNQGDSYKVASEQGYLWAPQMTQNGRTVPHHSNMLLLQKGHIVWHYAKGAIRAIGVVLAPAESALRPNPPRDKPRNQEGFLVRVEYHKLPIPIELQEIPLEWRQDESAQSQRGNRLFDKGGGVSQAYLFSLSPRFVGQLLGKFDGFLPESLREQLLVGVEKISGAHYSEPPLDHIKQYMTGQGLNISDRTLRRYHLALNTRGFVVLSGISGTGKTWLAEMYASAIGAKLQIVPVAPNWTANEDLLGYHNPVTNVYHDTAFSLFLREAAKVYQESVGTGEVPQPYHLVLDEMNLARVEYYFAAFLSVMEQRARNGWATISLGNGEQLPIAPNLFVIGTVNVDETTHGFADKVYDRAQLVELEVTREQIEVRLHEMSYRAELLAIWDAVNPVAPFAFRVLDEIEKYVQLAGEIDIPWQEALDEQLLQKVMPKLRGIDLRLGKILQEVVRITEDNFPLTHAKALRMLEGYQQHGIASFF